MKQNFFCFSDLVPFVVFFLALAGASHLGARFHDVTEGVQSPVETVIIRDDSQDLPDSIQIDTLIQAKVAGVAVPWGSFEDTAAGLTGDRDGADGQGETVVRDSLRKGESFRQALARLRLNREITEYVVKALSRHMNFRSCKPGETFCLAFDEEGRLTSLRYEKSPFDVFTVEADDEDSFHASREAVHLDRMVVKLSGIVEDSLFDSFAVHEENEKLVSAFANLFSSKIDFNTEIKNGDRFSLVFEKYYKDGDFIGYGRILAARYQGERGTCDAYYFEPSGREGRYFDAAGLELEASFLRSPLPVFKVTSRFSRSRLHPILGFHRPHLGIDLSAPKGTPVMAVADGTVTFAGWQRGYGNIAILQHAGGYETYYAHLAGFGPGIREGASLKQKQILGYVGMTGLATGPHLDYRLSHNKKFIDPLTVKAIPRAVLGGTARKSFAAHCDNLRNLLENGDGTRVVTVEKISVTGQPKDWQG